MSSPSARHNGSRREYIRDDDFRRLLGRLTPFPSGLIPCMDKDPVIAITVMQSSCCAARRLRIELPA